jgi:hypothetical protein
MFGKNPSIPNPDSIFDPRRQREIPSIFQICPPLQIRGTYEPYYEIYAFWTNPENILTVEDIAAYYCYRYGADFEYYTPSEEELWYTGYQSERNQDTDFIIPEVWGGNKR